MSDQTTAPRTKLATSILLFSGISITVLATAAIIIDTENTIMILNIVLPVFSTWVGTIIAFYFGRENFESANKQVRDLVNQVNIDKNPKNLVSSAMRTLKDTEKIILTSGKGDKDIIIGDLKAKYNDQVSRLPILNNDLSARYMIHSSLIDKYNVEGGKDTDSLEDLIKAKPNAMKLGKGFVVVSEKQTIEAANNFMLSNKPCQDVFITKNGETTDPLIGWVSNVRITRYLTI